MVRVYDAPFRPAAPRLARRRTGRTTGSLEVSLKPIVRAEDNDPLRRLSTDLLESAGLTCMAVSDGEKAIALLHKVTNPQLIILDIMMPRLSGIETCNRIRKMQGQNTCPILFLTALDRPETLLECLLAGGDDYLMKSASVAEIVERVQYWSRRGALEDIDDRRSRAVTQLEAMVAQMTGSEAERVSLEVSSEQANLDLLADFLAAKAGEFQRQDELLLSFGYLVGLVEGS